MEDSIAEKEFINHLWSYFMQHANQRMQLFHFYILLETFLFTGVFTFYGREKSYGICLVISIATILFTLVFLNLDTRTKQLIKNCEELISKVENDYKDRLCADFMIISYEKEKTTQQRQYNTFPLSYTKSLRWMFFVFFVAGIVSVVYSCYQMQV